jgi:hypothetical protein
MSVFRPELSPSNRRAASTIDVSSVKSSSRVWTPMDRSYPDRDIDTVRSLCINGLQLERGAGELSSISSPV